MQSWGDAQAVRYRSNRLISNLTRLVTIQLAGISWLAMALPSAAGSQNYYAYPYSYLSASDFRDCAARLLKVNVSAPAAATACAQALSPQNLSNCVAKIRNKTNNTAVDTLAVCSQARRPLEVADCVVGVSHSTDRKADPADLDYCGRTLLPGRFADCVVGLRRSLNFSPPILALDTCISATDQLFDLSPNFVPQNGTAPIPFPTPVTPQTTQPVAPNSLPATPGNSGYPSTNPLPATPSNPVYPSR